MTPGRSDPWLAAALLFCALAMTPSAGAATQIGICGGPDGAYLTSDGAGYSVLVGAVPPNCPTIMLPVEREQVLWAGVMPAAAPAGQPATLVGSFADPVEVSEITPLTGGEAVSPALAPTPLRARVFGVEERATFDAEARVLDCKAGRRPAGLVIEPSRRPPRLRMAYRSTMPTKLAASNGVGDGTPLATAAAAPNPRPLLLPWHGRSHLTVSCPGPGRFELLSLGPPASGWAWRPSAWREAPERLLSQAEAWGMGSLFVTVPVEGGRVADADALTAFVSRAAGMGVAVWAVDGDPRAVLPAERPHFVARAEAYAAYNRSVPPASRLAGLQLDIEPHVLRGYGQAPGEFDRAWARTIIAIAGAAGMPVEAVIPFWYADEPHRSLALAPVAGSVASLAVMAYRGTAEGVTAAAASALAWGAAAGIPVRVAMENGPVPDAEARTFRPAPIGTLWQVAIGDRTAVLLLAKAAANPAGPTLGLASRMPVSGRSVSFLGDTGSLADAIERVIRGLGDHPAFHGIALHGILD